MSDNSLILREDGWRQCDRVDQSYSAALVSHSVEDDITMRDFRFYKRWDKDYRSLPEDEARALPPSQVDTR